MSKANASVFERLVSFAETRGVSIPDRQEARWVSSTIEEKERLKHSEILISINFGRFRHLSWIAFNDIHYIASFGFEHEMSDPSLIPLEDAAGFDVCLLSEIPVFPSASAIEVLDVVAAGSKKDGSGYHGHDNFMIRNLFPPLRIYECVSRLDEGTVWPNFLSICAAETQHGGSWIDLQLADSLAALAQSPIDYFPYQELCRSTLDLDPRSLFMSLYRCIEATYAHEKATKLKNALSVEHSWSELAAILESEMSWRPLEAESLNNVLKHASEDDLEEICKSLKRDTGKNIAASAGAAIYKLRNRIVHYRPTKDPFDMNSIDWNHVCTVLVSIARDVFHRAYHEEKNSAGSNP